MSLKIHNLIAAFALLVAGLAGSLSNDATATSLRIASTNETSRDEKHKPAVVAVSYSPPVNSNLARSGANAEIQHKSQDKLSVSAVPEVDKWALFIAMLGLAGMRLRRGGKQYLPTIN